jgi:DNA-binding NarL/FixJ family response regulator
MADLGPILVVVGGDTKRLQWLTHHVTSHWPSAQVTTLRAGETASLSRLVSEGALDAVVLQADFANEALAGAALNTMTQLLRIQPTLYCILLAENGNEMSAVRALKGGAKDYLPLTQITRDQLLATVGEACAKRRIAAQAAAMMAQSENSTIIEVPGYSIVKEIATSNFSSVFLARSERLRRNVVLKVMTRGESEREMGDAERFQREYEIISSITHRAIAEIYDFGSLPGHLYLAMEYFP